MADSAGKSDAGKSPAIPGEQGTIPLAQPAPGVVPSALPPPSLISLEEFQKVQLRIGTIVSAQPHPNADRLLVLTVDIGEPLPRQLVAGIRASYEPEGLVGKQVVVVANLKSATLRGIESQGMVLAASSDGAVVLLSPERTARSGSTVK